MLSELDQLKIYLKSILGIPSGNIYFIYQYFLTKKVIVLSVIGLIGAFIGKGKFISKIKIWTEENLLGLVLKYIIYLVLFIIAILFMLNSSYSSFLYFQF